MPTPQSKWKEKNRDYTRQYARDYYKSFTKSWNGYCILFFRRCRKYNKDTDVTFEFLVDMPQYCTVSGKSFEYENIYGTFSNPLAPSIDRIDSHKGYYKDNVQIVLNCINKMKNDMPNDKFLQLWKDITWPAF